MECPDENALVALAEGAGEGAERAVLARHLDECPSCRITVASLVRLVETPSDRAQREGDDHEAALAPTVANDEPPGARATTGEPVAGSVVGQRFRLERVVGEGGLGVVWAATDVATQRPFALKILKFRYAELDKRLLREARVSGVLQHPNIVDVHEIVQLDDGSLAMVMDLLEGEPLDRHLSARARLTLGETLRIMHPVMAALMAAHAQGIVHRDLKPQNIFLAREGSGAMRPVLLDFGLAKLTATDGAAAQTSELTKDKQLLGTPHYMAPEQLYGELDIDARTDVWGVGAVLFECLSGRRPLSGTSVGQVLRSLATREIPKIESLVPGLPPQIASMIDAMLTRDRATRPVGLGPLAAVAASLLSSGIS